MRQHQKDELLLLSEACAAAGVSYYRAWSAVVGGRVAAERRGTRWFVRPSDLRKLLTPARAQK